MYIGIHTDTIHCTLNDMLTDDKNCKMKLVNEEKELYQIENEDLIYFMVDFLERLDVNVNWE